MMDWLRFLVPMLNGAAVSLFGGVLAAAFCDATSTRRNKVIFWWSMAGLLLLLGIAHILFGESMNRKLYPLVMHLPLWLLLRLLTKQRLWPMISVLLAYMCCQVRRWFALFWMAVLPSSELTQGILELIITLPLLFLLLRHVAPVMRELVSHTHRMQLQLAIIPALYYVFDYVAGIYTEWLLEGVPAAIEFMPFVCSVAYVVFLTHIYVSEHNRMQMEEEQKLLHLQFTQLLKEIETLRESQELTKRYRHDMRHHLQYLSNCIQNGKHEQAQAYITDIYQEIEAQQMQHYCENETVNLLLSAYAERAKKVGAQLKVTGSLPAFGRIADRDLCVLLSNALENAMKACHSLDHQAEHEIHVQFIQKEHLLLQITNPVHQNVRFVDGIPIADEPGHGQGVRSICAIVYRYGGMCSFQEKDGQFVFRMSI